MRRHGTTSAGDKILRGRLGWAAFKCGPEGFARRNASPMQGDQGAAVQGVILELLQVGGPNPKKASEMERAVP